MLPETILFHPMGAVASSTLQHESAVPFPFCETLPLKKEEERGCGWVGGRRGCPLLNALILLVSLPLTFFLAPLSERYNAFQQP